jgi:serine O-acetyltransferase
MASSLSLKELIKQDIIQYIKFSADFSEENFSKLRMLSAFLTPSIMCCFIYRLAHWFYQRGFQLIARLITRLNYLIHKADISPAAEIGPGLYIPHTPGIAFYGHAGKNLTLYALALVVTKSIHVERHHDVNDAPLIGNNVILGAYSVVKGALVIGDNSTVGPNCYLMESIPANTTLHHTEKINIIIPAAKKVV